MASPFDLSESIERAQKRLGTSQPNRKKRSDLGKFRMPLAVQRHLGRLLATQDHPGIQRILENLRHFCQQRELTCPSRATVYKFMQRHPGPAYPVAELPSAVQAALYNLSPEVDVPGPQLAFYCFNYGQLPAQHFAAGLPWLPLYQAFRMRGWRPRSRGLLRAVLAARGIPHA